MNRVFIPIKSISQRVPGKNFRMFGEHELWRHLLLKLISDDYRVYVDTDNEKLKQTINAEFADQNIVAYARHESLRGHEVSVNALIKYFIEGVCDRDDNVVQVHTTTPFLKQLTITKAFKMLESKQYDSIAGCDVHQTRGWRIESKGSVYNQRFIPLNHNPMILEQTQDIEPLYTENSVIYGFSVKSFMECKNRIGHRPYFMPIEFPENLDIDDERDWTICSTLQKMYETKELL